MFKIKILLFLSVFLSTIQAKELIYEDINSLIIQGEYTEAEELLKFSIYKNGNISNETKRLSNKLDKLKSLTQDIENDKLQVTTNINGIEYNPKTGQRVSLEKFYKLKDFMDNNSFAIGVASLGLVVYSVKSLCEKYGCESKTTNYSSGYKADSLKNSNISQDSIKFNITGYEWNFGVSCSPHRYKIIHKGNSSHNRDYDGFKRSGWIDGGVFDGSYSGNGSAFQNIKDTNGNFGGKWEFEFACQDSSSGRDKKVFYKTFHVGSGTKNIELKINYGNGTVRVID